MVAGVIPKVTHCKTCPAFASGKGRCSAGGAPVCDIYVLGSAPTRAMEAYGFVGFGTDSGLMYKSIISSVKGTLPGANRLRVRYHHAAHCYDSKMNTDIIHHCSTLVQNDIFNANPKVILVLGTDAMKSLDIKGTVSEMRGQELTASIGRKDIPIVISFDAAALIKKEHAGKIPTVKSDIAMALKVALNGVTKRKPLSELTKDYKFCKTPQEFKELVDMVLSYPADLPDGTQGPAESNLLALDTETAIENNKYSAINTWAPGFKMIAISVSWAEGKSAGILLNHRANKFKYEDFKEDIARLCNAPNPKTFHNYKYDYKALTCSQGYTINNVVFDSQMGEFLLDENKKGEYGLKKITKNRVPMFYGYEKMLHSPEDATKQTVEDLKTAVAEAALKIKDLRADGKYYRTLLKEVNSQLGDKTKSKEVRAAEKEVLTTLKKERNDKLAVIKITLATEVQKNKDRKELIKNKKSDLEDMKDMSFEDYDVDTMLLYAAIDTDISRRIAKQQIAEIKKDSVRLFNVLSKIMLPAARMFGDMEHTGVKVDLEYIEELKVHFEKVIVEAEQAVYAANGGRELNLNSANALVDMLTTNFGVKLTKTTKSGAWSTDSDVMEDLATKYPIAEKIIAYKKAYKARWTFLKGILEGGKSPHDYGCSIDGRIHGSYNQTTAATGRLCIAKGSLVDVIRDISKHPEGVPIEDIKVGDLVYSYDSDKKLVIKPVVWSGKTGHKRVIRLNWTGTSNHTFGHIDVTPDHKIKCLDGEYREAGKLKVGARILSLGRSKSCGYARLHPYGNKELIEHKFIMEQVTGETFEHVHHNDENKLNNEISNLQGMTSKAHTSLHASVTMQTPEMRKRISDTMKEKHADSPEIWAHTYKKGEEHVNYIKVGRYTLLKKLARASGAPTRCRGMLGLKDYTVLMKKVKEAGIDWRMVELRYSNTKGNGGGGSGEYLSKGRVLQALQKSSKVSHLMKDLRIGSAKVYKLLKHYDLSLDLNNHRITSIEVIDTPVDVYCLEVEDTHNFICNELCVKNSSSTPNQQNIPLYILDKNIKKIFIPDSDEYYMVDLDYSAAEVRILTAYAPDPELIRVLDAGMDTHSFVGSGVFEKQGVWGTAGVTYDDLKNRESLMDTDFDEFKRLDTMRQIAKKVMFLTIYGGGAYTLRNNLASDGINMTEEDCNDIINNLLTKFPAIKEYMRVIKNTVNQKGEVETFLGRKRRFPVARFNFKLRKAAYREAINAPIQGTSSDVVIHQMVELRDKLEELGYKYPMRLTVHDSKVFQFPKKDIQKLLPILQTHCRDNVKKNFKWLPVDFEFDVNIGISYGEAKSNLRKAVYDTNGKIVNFSK